MLSTNKLLKELDRCIAALQQARAALADGASRKAGKVAPTKREKSTMSEEGRARIAEAQRKRWAKQRRAAKTTAKTMAKVAK
jgi:hypothetical protein